MRIRTAIAILCLGAAMGTLPVVAREDPRMQSSAKIEAYICAKSVQTRRCEWKVVLGTTLIETHGDVKNPIVTTREMTLSICNVILERQFIQLQAKIIKDHPYPVVVEQVRCIISDELKI